jgi:UDP-N-acetylglucosamine/UDP-N-acetylgalactosamine diphosphorylase
VAADTSQDPVGRLEAAGQQHLVEHAETLAPDRRAAFLRAATAWPWEDLRRALKTPPRVPPVLRPPQALTWRRQLAQGSLRPRLTKLGRGLLAGGRVATLLLAGGQGTRLGVSGPKGSVVFGPEPDRTLYRIHAERVAAASETAGAPVPLLVLVSPATEALTREAFAVPGDFGLDDDQVRILVQGQLPCLDEAGRALLAAPGALALAPDGHGGAFGALVASGELERLAAAGIDALTTFQVDNPLGRSLDPVMLGWMVERRLQAIGKAVRKATPDERVGVFARDLRGRHRIVEYGELPQTEPGAPPAPGEALPSTLELGSIAIHGFSVPWLAALAEAGTELPLHRAHKKVAHVTPHGTTVMPEAPNAWKLERFIFDLFPAAERAEVHEVDREFEFAPVKNPAGVDSLASARAMVADEVRRWHRQHGRAEPSTPSLRPRELDGGREADEAP